MKTKNLKTHYASALVIGAILAMGPAMADKPSWSGSGKGGKDEHMERRDEQKGERHGENDRHRDGGEKRGDGAGQGRHFEGRHQAMVRDYYAAEFHGGHCPPGLAKKHNGCMPPGQAKKWQMGRPLPAGVRYYDVPQPLLLQIGQPPSGYRYVRVSSDILMMALGSGMIVDAIRDLGR